MKLSDDLSPRWIVVKGLLFFLILLAASVLVVVLDERWPRVVALLCVIWSSARLYYFFFYVIEQYLDSSFRFSGLWSAVQFLLQRRKGGPKT
ncbi:MAG: hypothetical protein QNL33_17815 [Akkermansiaceae bacterium]|jgi:hypothetical protein